MFELIWKIAMMHEHAFSHTNFEKKNFQGVIVRINLSYLCGRASKLTPTILKHFHSTSLRHLMSKSIDHLALVTKSH